MGLCRVRSSCRTIALAQKYHDNGARFDRYLEVCHRIARDPKCRFVNVADKVVQSAVEGHQRPLEVGAACRASPTTHFSEYKSTFAKFSCRSISCRIMPVFSATSALSYLRRTKESPVIKGRFPRKVTSIGGRAHPLSALNTTSGFEFRYSTVGKRVPICRRRRWLKICATSFLAYRSRPNEVSQLLQKDRINSGITLTSNSNFHMLATSI